ncbi:MAG: xylulokinase [Clostridia bacterium]
MAYLMGIDIGTSGTKTALYDEAGLLQAEYTAAYPLYQPQNGWAEQEPEDWWNAVVTGIRAVLAKSRRCVEDIAGIGLSGQMHGLVMLDCAGQVLRRAIIWCDQRTVAECEEITNRVGYERLIAITANPALTGFTASKLLWVRNHQPELYARCAHVLLPKDYIRWKLTQTYATEVSDASGTQLLDIPKRAWSPEVLERLEIDLALLPRVYESPEITGTLTVQAARETGLKADTPVVGGAGDNAAAAVGTGTVRAGRAFTTIGSSGVVYAHTDHVTIDPKGRVHTFCCAVPGAWHVMGVTQGAGLSLKWFRDQFCGAEKQAAEALDQDPYVLLNQEAALSPIGANRLLYLPYLMGERTPHLDPHARGVFFGLSAMHQRRDLLRAVMEGVSYSLMDCLSVFEEMGQQVTQMTACGGGAKSPLWREMLADIYGCDIMTLRNQEGPALGVAILAGVGTGIYRSVPEACDALLTAHAVQSPNMQRQARYAPYYQCYRALYPALREEFVRLATLPA